MVRGRLVGGRLLGSPAVSRLETRALGIHLVFESPFEFQGDVFHGRGDLIKNLGAPSERDAV